MLVVVCFLIEVGVYDAMIGDPLQELAAAPLYGPRQKRKLCMGRTSKLKMLVTSMKRCGGSNAVMDALADGPRGFANAVRNVCNHEYSRIIRSLMGDSKGAALHWDGAM